MTLQVPMKHSGALGLLWLDLETTGSDHNQDEIIEIGSIFTYFDFEYQSSFEQIVDPSEYALGRMMKNSIVREMHTENGLLDDILLRPSKRTSIQLAEKKLLDWLDLTINRSKRRGPVGKFSFMLAGSGVGHFDRRFIDRHMPTLAKHLVFSPLDIGNIRRLASMSDYQLPSPATDQSAKNHRALDDIKQHLEEARAFRDMFTQLAQQQELATADGR